LWSMYSNMLYDPYRVKSCGYAIPILSFATSSYDLRST